MFFFNHMVLKTANEAVVESMGCIVDKHATGARGLGQPKYAREAFIHWNGPKPHDSDRMLAAALDLHFKGEPWHFVKNDRGLRVEDDLKRWKVSKVVDRLASEPSRLPFMADGKPAAALERERDATRCGL